VNNEWQLFYVAAKSKSVMSAANFRLAVRGEAGGSMRPERSAWRNAAVCRSRETTWL